MTPDEIVDDKPCSHQRTNHEPHSWVEYNVGWHSCPGVQGIPDNEEEWP